MISITPKKYFHDLIARHADKVEHQTGNLSQVSASGFNCSWENLVAVSSFVLFTGSPDLTPPLQHQHQYFVPAQQEVAGLLSACDARGPPYNG